MRGATEAGVGTRRALRRLVCVILMTACGLLVATPLARAQVRDVGAAAQAFSRAQRAEVRGDLALAAQLYELADSLAPTPEAQRSAARARLDAGQLSSAAGHAEQLLQRYPSDAASFALASSILARARAELVHVSVRCTLSCELALDGRSLALGASREHSLYASAGSHVLAAQLTLSGRVERAFEGAAGSDVQLVFEPAPAPPREPSGRAQPSLEARPERSHGARVLSPWVGVSLMGAGAIVSGLSLWSYLDTRAARDAFVRHPTQAGFEDGERRDLRTNVLLSSGLVVMVTGSVLTALSVYRLRAGRRALPHADVTLGRATIGLSYTGSL